MPSQVQFPHLQNGYNKGNLEDCYKHYMRWCASNAFRSAWSAVGE